MGFVLERGGELLEDGPRAQEHRPPALIAPLALRHHGATLHMRGVIRLTAARAARDRIRRKDRPTWKFLPARREGHQESMSIAWLICPFFSASRTAFSFARCSSTSAFDSA